MTREDIAFLKDNGYYKFPNMIQIEITQQCPFHCKQCYKKSLSNADIDFNRLCDFLDYISNNGTKLITLNGGEPLLYPRFIDLLEKIQRLPLSVNVFTSGYSLDETVIEHIKNNGNLNFYVSLNGSNSTVNDYSREGFDVSISAIRRLCNSRIRYGINWVARHDNVADFCNILDLCIHYNVAFLSITSNKLTGIYENDAALSKADLELLADQINGRNNKQVPIYIESCFSLLSTRIVGSNKNSFSAHCYAGISNCNVNYDFTYQPCTHLKYPEDFSSLEGYWHNSLELRLLRDNPPNRLAPCANCRYVKNCSFCRAMNEKTHNNYSVGITSCIGFEK